MQLSLRKTIFPILVIIILVLAFNIDFLLKSGINTFTPLSVHKLEGSGLRWKQLSFQKLDFSYQNMEVSLDKLNIDLSFQKSAFIVLPLVEKVSIDKLSLSITNTAEDSVTEIANTSRSNTEQIKISDYRPKIIYQQLNKLDIYIKQLEISQPTLFKQTLVFSNFILEQAKQNAGELRLSSDITEPQSGDKLSLEFFIRHQDSLENYSLNILLNESNKIQVTLDFSFDKAEQATINAHIKAQANQSINSLLKNYLAIMDIVEIKQVHTDTNFIICSTDALDIENIEQAFLESKINTTTQTHIHLHNQIFDEVIFNGHFQENGKRNNNGELLKTLSFPKQKLLRLIPNKKHDFYKSNVSLAFLSHHPINIEVLDNSIWKIHKNTLTASPALYLSWSKAGNNVYLDTQLEQVHVEFSPSQINTDLSYQLSGRWNRYFSSEHQGKLVIDSSPKVNQHTLKATINDSRLASTIKLILEQNQESYSGNFDIRIPEISKARKHINQSLGYWDNDLNLLSGSLAVSGDFDALKSSQDNYELSYSLDTSLTNINLDYDGFLFRKLDSRASFKGHGTEFSSVSKFPIRIQEIDTGVILKDFEIFAQAHMDMDKDSSILFSDLSAQVLGGTLTGENFTFYLPHTADKQVQQYHSEFTLWLDNIHLAEMLALANNPEIQGQGLLEGKLPVYLDEEVTLIKQGYLKNKDRGYIRFVPDLQSRDSLKQNPQMALLINVLTHLNYDELSADVNLDAKGKMNLNGSIKGVNPDFKKGYPIHFNPSIELDFTDMLRSLQISDSIDKKLRSRVNKKKLD